MAGLIAGLPHLDEMVKRSRTMGTKIEVYDTGRQCVIRAETYPAL